MGSNMMDSGECLVPSCPPSTIHLDLLHVIFSDEFIIYFGTIFFLLPCVWILPIKCFYLLSYSYLALSQPNVCIVKSLIHYNLLLGN